VKNIKKTLFVFLLLIISFISFLFYNHQQPPNVNDVYKGTKKWSPSINEVYAIEKVDNRWLTFFGSKNALYIAKLEQNWIGNWQLIDDLGTRGVLATAHYSNSKGVVWGASGVDKKISYYFGMVSNPEVVKVMIFAQGKEHKVSSFIHSNGKRFFFFKTEGNVVPYTFKALSENGEIIASTPPKK
jgi:hypothetical protein